MWKLSDWIIAAVAVVFVCGLWAVGFIYVKRGHELGSVFTVVEALFTGLAFAGVIFALFKQIEDGRESRQDFDETLKIQAQIAKAQTIQARLNAMAALIGSINSQIDHDNQSYANSIAREGGYASASLNMQMDTTKPLREQRKILTKEMHELLDELKKENLQIDPQPK